MTSSIHFLVHLFIPPSSFIPSSIHFLVHPFTHSFVPSCTLKFILPSLHFSAHPFIHIFTHSSIYFLTHSFLGPPFYPLIHLSLNKSLYSSTPLLVPSSFYSPLHPFILSSITFLVHSFTHSLPSFLHALLHSFLHSPINKFTSFNCFLDPIGILIHPFVGLLPCVYLSRDPFLYESLHPHQYIHRNYNSKYREIFAMFMEGTQPSLPLLYYWTPIHKGKHVTRRDDKVEKIDRVACYYVGIGEA